MRSSGVTRQCIGAFRITSTILPLATHPVSGYHVAALDDGDAIAEACRAVRPRRMSV